jgi:hypothetical protein
MKSVISLTFFSLLTLSVTAQKITIDWVELSDNKVILHYTLEDSNPAHQYLVNVFNSQDNFTSALTKVSGDVGPEVKPGISKRIIWDMNQELPNFKGNLRFEIRARVFIPFIKLNTAGIQKAYKRGKNYPLEWASGNLSGQVNIELFKGQDRIPVENNVPNVGKYQWHISSGLKKGSDYRLKFTNTKDRNDFIYSPSFTIKPKIPMVVKIATVAVIGAGVAVVVGSQGGETPSTESALPTNPGKPN